jgi:hypothetical protein
VLGFDPRESFGSLENDYEHEHRFAEHVHEKIGSLEARPGDRSPITASC